MEPAVIAVAKAGLELVKPVLAGGGGIQVAVLFPRAFPPAANG